MPVSYMRQSYKEEERKSKDIAHTKQLVFCSEKLSRSELWIAIRDNDEAKRYIDLKGKNNDNASFGYNTTLYH